MSAWIAGKLADLLSCLCDAVENHGAGPVCWCGVQPGADVAWDFCGDCGDTCGMAYIKFVEAFPSAVFPVPDDGETGCRSPLAYSLEIGVLRCLPVGPDGEPLTTGEALDATLATVLDMEAVRRAVECCFGGALVALQRWEPSGPSGGCVGGAWTLVVADG